VNTDDRADTGPPVRAHGAPLVDVRDLSRSFDHGRIHALRGVSLRVERGEWVAITGPSGSGKSTLLHLIGALDRPSGGEVLIDGRGLGSEPDLAGFRARTVGFVFQSFNLLPALTASENVQVPMFEGALPSGERRARAEGLLRRVGLGDRMDERPAHLSGGERQRVAIARSLANEPRLLLADEPTGNLDSGSAGVTMDLLDELRRERGLTLLVVTHSPEIAARAGRTIRLLDGRVVP